MKSKIKLRDVVIFLAGAEFFHMLSHIVLTSLISFPWQTKVMIVSKSLNSWAILINGAVTVALLVYAAKLKKK